MNGDQMTILLTWVWLLSAVVGVIAGWRTHNGFYIVAGVFWLPVALGVLALVLRTVEEFS